MNALPAIESEALQAYVEQVLIAELEPGTVFLLDNLATHKNVAGDLARAMNVEFATMAFAKLTSLIRKPAARTHDYPWVTASRTCNVFFDEECSNCFKAAVYEADRALQPYHGSANAKFDTAEIWLDFSGIRYFSGKATFPLTNPRSGYS